MCSHVVTVTSVVYWYWKEFQELSLYLIYWIGGLVLKGCPGKVQVNREQLHPVEQLEGTKILHNISSNCAQCRRHLMTIRVELGEV